MPANPGQRFLVFVAVLAAAATVVIVAGQSTDGETRSSEVFVVGDSLTVAALDYIPAAMADRGVDLAGVDARNGRNTPQGLDILRAAAPTLPDTVLVALGTNDVYFATEQSVDQSLETARSIVGDRRLIWVNLRVDPSRSSILALEQWDEINAWLAVAAPRYGIELADWAVWSSINGVDVGDDGIHYEPDESARRAEFYADVVAGRIQTST